MSYSCIHLDSDAITGRTLTRKICNGGSLNHISYILCKHTLFELAKSLHRGC